MAKRSLDELWQAYKETLPPLDAAREEHDRLYRESTEAYKRWISAGGDSMNEPEDDTTKS